MKFYGYGIAIVFVTLWTSSVLANVGPVFISGEQIEANMATQVVLERETIDILLSPMSAEVVCHFYLRNTGETEHLTLAFPGKDIQEGDIHNRTMNNFAVSIDGHQISTAYQTHFTRSPQAHMQTISSRYG